MKKFLLSLVALLATLGAWAQAITAIGSPVTDLSTITNWKYDQYFVVQVVKFKASDVSEQDGIYLYTIDTNDRIRARQLDFNSENNYQHLFNIQQTTDGHFLLYVNEKGIPSFAKTASGGFSINKGHTPNDYAILPVDGQDGVFMLRGYADDRAYLNVVSSEVRVTGNETDAMYIKIFNVSPNENYTYTAVLSDNLGNKYNFKYFSFVNDAPPSLDGLIGHTFTNVDCSNKTYTATINFPFPISSETVANPTFISTYNYSNQPADQFKWYASDNKIKVKEGEEIFSSSIASHLWLIYPNFENGVFTFQIKNVATGLFINSSDSDNNHDDKSKVILSNENEATDFTVGKRGSEGAEFINSFAKRLSVNTSAPNPADKIQTVGTFDTHSGTALTFPVPGFNVTIGSTGYATLYSPITVCPEDQTLEIYQIESAPKNNSVTLSQMSYVHKNQGVILKGNSETEYWFALTDWDSFTEEDWKFNKLKGSYVDTYVAGPAYVLANGGNGVGLYKAELNKNANGEAGETYFLNNAGKAYLPVEDAAEARFLVFDFGTETAIESVEAEAATDAVVYDLAGRRVKAAQKGLYIVNGKVVIK